MGKSDLIIKFVNQKIHLLQNNDPWSKAMLAKLRRGIGKNPLDYPETWEITMSDIPEDLTDKRVCACRITEGELAIYTALTLFALHQQGKSNSVNTGTSFSAAVRRLMNDGNENSVKRRFDAAVTSTDVYELAYHARGLIQLMKSSDMIAGFDYGIFARDLYQFQYPDGKREVCLRWGHDFYKLRAEENDEKGE